MFVYAFGYGRQKVVRKIILDIIQYANDKKYLI